MNIPSTSIAIFRRHSIGLTVGKLRILGNSQRIIWVAEKSPYRYKMIWWIWFVLITTKYHFWCATRPYTGPSLFFLLINDIPNASKKTLLFVCTDDLNLLRTQMDPAMLTAEKNTEIKGVVGWLIAKLSSNIDNTHVALPKKRHASIEFRGNFIINGIKITWVERTKFI